MAGADVIFDRESNRWRRVSWAVLLIVCITLLAAQVSDRIQGQNRSTDGDRVSLGLSYSLFRQAAFTLPVGGRDRR